MEIFNNIKYLFYFACDFFEKIPQNYKYGIVLFFAISLILTTILSISCEKKKKKIKKKINKTPFISTLEINDYYYNDVYLDKRHKIKKIWISKKGVFLLFYDFNLKGVIEGKVDDEILIMSNKEIKNPLLLKYGFINKINIWLKTDRKNITPVIISKRVKKTDSDLLIYKTESDFKTALLNKKEILTNEEIHLLNEKISFLDKRKRD